MASNREREELHKAIWSIADDLRGSVDGWDFKQYVLGIMFYRYISENITNYINEGERKAGGEVVLSKVKSNLSSVVGSGTKYKSRSTGELEGALGLSEVRLDRNGNYNIKVGFAETRRDGTSNAKLANIIEYGKSGQVAKPFMKPAKASSKAKCIEVMKSTFDKEVNNI